jgi:hypothetical protein
MVCGLFSALSVIFRVPVKVPVAVGVNVTLITQLFIPPVPVGWMVAPVQVVALVTTAKGPPLLLIVGVPRVSGVVPGFVTVIDSSLVLPFDVVGKVSSPDLKLLELKAACGSITRTVSGTSSGIPPLGVMAR